jgi:hypothetical protein
MDENYDELSGIPDPASLLPFLAFMFAFAFVCAVSQWRIFQKAGKPGWAAILPIYNLYVLLKIVGKPGWWMLLYLVPFVNFYVAIKTVHLLSKSFGKDALFTVGLLFLPFVFYPILGFGAAKYEGPHGDPEAFAAFQNKHTFEFENAG